MAATKADMDAAAAKELAASKARDEAAAKRLDETVPGGRYIVNGVLVNCDGEPIADADNTAPTE